MSMRTNIQVPEKYRELWAKILKWERVVQSKLSDWEHEIDDVNSMKQTVINMIQQERQVELREKAKKEKAKKDDAKTKV